jgi:hypothetical protein
MTHATEVVKLGGSQRIKIEQHSFVGTLWFGAWLFTIAFVKLSFWKAVLALVIWPYYLGVVLRAG